MATVKINGKEISVEDGTLILDAARQAGFEIPTFCYQARLSRLGSCRMCLVEIGGQKKMQPSCVTPIIHGMEVFTENATVKTARSSMLEFLLANHPLDCPTCDKGGECELQDLAFKFGPRRSGFIEWKRRFHDKDKILSPIIIKNHNRCIHCERCVRICDEVVGVTALGGIGRGYNTKETSFMDDELDCDHCGNCIEVCPVGSFMSLPYRYQSRPWDLNETDTVCPYCATGCQFTIGSRNGEVLRVRSKIATGINKETLCARGRFGYHFIQNKERLTKPMIKKAGKLTECSWEEALSQVRTRFANAKKAAGIASARLTNEELYVFQKLMRNVFRTNNIDSTIRWADKNATSAMIDICNLAGEGVSISDAMKADLIFIIGSSISDENPITDYLIRTSTADKRKTLILAYPRRIKLDSSATISLKYRPGSEGIVISGIAAAIEGTTPPAPPLLKEGIRGVDGSDISEADILTAADRIKKASNVSVFVGTDILRLANGKDALLAIADMAKALKGAGKNVKVMPVLDRSNQRGAWDMGVHPVFLPGYKNLTPTHPSPASGEGAIAEGMDCGEILEASSKGEIDAVYIIGEDIVSLYPDAGFAKDALSKAGFIVVQDIFLTETAKMADVVLPGASYAEKDGTLTNQEGRVQRLRRAIQPVKGAKEDLNILCSIGRFEYKSAKDVFEEIRKEAPGYQDISFDSLNNTGVLVKGHGAENQVTRGQGVKGSGRTDVSPVSSIEDKDYPLQLMTGNHLFHSGRLSQKADVLKKLLPESFVEISDKDAAALDINEGERVVVNGKHHEAVLRVRVKQGSLKGIAFIPENFEEVSVNRFFKKGEGIPRVNISKL
ncbi:MAG: NADH dehydrogenase (quinone) subunit G [Deltaproteobacteria bacterium RIFCSPLOWO2_12_FULL_43_16]|nr:MAG: NADH dehydrogenase (quinone) subunit G [Deltaproteobacteria bacterium GWA2_43_19]OGQ09584.1 MAG: NADH dehydrogenase (quinone) subunit G [Deltaproteobacteria bacterium RIFCSPHIGHO2_02_FULL_43_33]OGQ58219.1 MAG: NADH dehydrogenase (quinone) subunit G [Deltaproteobacteria bacterium RIFCSPLOWO2_12_FULL_43_16]HBR16209.1 NADH dehydrogenase (quinone) subunit G [Deltaproteobacteria bacterium]